MKIASNYWFKQLKKITEADGVSGNEIAVSTLVKKELDSDKSLTFEYDNLGSLGVISKGTGGDDAPIIMLAAHTDEVGFVVNNVDDKGFVHFSPVGGWWGHVVLGQLFNIHTSKGLVAGVVGSVPPHLIKTSAEAKKVIDLDKMFLDISAKDKKEAEKFGIKPGDMIVPKAETTLMANGDHVMGKAMDDRASLVYAIEVMRNLKDVKHEATIIMVATVQEEVGLRGARTSAFKFSPDVALALDVTIANDTPSIPVRPTVLGSGVALSLFDRSIISNPKLRDYIETIVVKNKIPYTFDSLAAGGTDAGAIHLSKDGVPTMTLSLPSRYIHSHNSIVSIHDMQASFDLTFEFVKNFTKKDLEKIKF